MAKFKLRSEIDHAEQGHKQETPDLPDGGTVLSPYVLSRALVCGREMTTFVPVIHIVAGAEKAKGTSEAPALVSIYPRRRVALIEEAHVPFA